MDMDTPMPMDIDILPIPMAMLIPTSTDARRGPPSLLLILPPNHPPIHLLIPITHTDTDMDILTHTVDIIVPMDTMDTMVE